MNNYPDGFRPRVEQFEIDMICPNCGWEWEAIVLKELGCTWFAREEDEFCPECGEEGEQK